MMGIKIRVIAYTRISQEDIKQQDTSLDNQKLLIEEYCKRKGYDLLKVFNEGFFSGKDRNKPKLNALFKLEVLKSNTFEAIVIKDLDRFSRNAGEIADKVKILKACNIRLLTVNDEDLTADTMITNIKGSIAAESITKGQKEQRLMLNRKEKERSVFGQPPFGFKTDHIIVDGKIVKNGWKLIEEDAKIVKKIFNDFIDGYNFSEIGRKYNFTSAGVSKMLKNKKYIRIMEYTLRYKVDGVLYRTEKRSYKIKGIKFIISKDLFNQVQKKFGVLNNGSR